MTIHQQIQTLKTIKQSFGDVVEDRKLGGLIQLAEEMAEIITQQAAEIERLRQALIIERDDALIWDDFGTVSRINKVLEEEENP
jgi:Mg2+/Co2+ transporter CorB